MSIFIGILIGCVIVSSFIFSASIMHPVRVRAFSDWLTAPTPARVVPTAREQRPIDRLHKRWLNYGSFSLCFERCDYAEYSFLKLHSYSDSSVDTCFSRHVGYAGYGDSPVPVTLMPADLDRTGRLLYVLNGGRLSELDLESDLTAIKRECLLLTAKRQGGEEFEEVFTAVIERQPVLAFA